MPLTREVKIIKVPLSDKERMPDYPKSFPRMPRLYLELLENKAKIKQDLINKEYIPPHNGEKIEKTTVENHTKNHDTKQNTDRKQHHDKNHDTVSEKGSISNDTSISIDSNKKKEKFTEETEIREKDSHKISRKHSHSDSVTERSDDSHDSHDSRDSRSDYGSDSDSDRDSRRESGETITDHSEGSDSRRDSRRDRRERRDSDKETDSRQSDALSDRLKELLGDTQSEKSKSKENYTDKYNKAPKESVTSRASSHFTPYDKYKKNKEEEQPKGAPPPTLAELEARGHYHGKAELRDINHVGMNEYEEEDRKRDLIFRFDMLKKSYPLAAPTIPEYTIHSDLREMQKSYDATVKRLSLDSSVENYKTYLIGGFMVVEFVFGNFLGFDMQGFTQQQIVTMHSYEKLLIELGEKSYVPSGSKWPVEMRLLFLIIMNAGFFIVSKMIMRKTGANLLNMVNSMNTTANTNSSVPPRQKRRMKGPNINVDDIPDADDNAQPQTK